MKPGGSTARTDDLTLGNSPAQNVMPSIKTGESWPGGADYCWHISGG